MAGLEEARQASSAIQGEAREGGAGGPTGAQATERAHQPPRQLPQAGQGALRKVDSGAALWRSQAMHIPQGHPQGWATGRGCAVGHTGAGAIACQGEHAAIAQPHQPQAAVARVCCHQGTAASLQQQASEATEARAAARAVSVACRGPPSNAGHAGRGEAEGAHPAELPKVHHCAVSREGQASWALQLGCQGGAIHRGAAEASSPCQGGHCAASEAWGGGGGGGGGGVGGGLGLALGLAEAEAEAGRVTASHTQVPGTPLGTAPCHSTSPVTPQSTCTVVLERRPLPAPPALARGSRPMKAGGPAQPAAMLLPAAVESPLRHMRALLVSLGAPEKQLEGGEDQDPVAARGAAAKSRLALVLRRRALAAAPLAEL